MRFVSTAKVLSKCKLKYSRISEWRGNLNTQKYEAVSKQIVNDREVSQIHCRF